MWLAYCKKVYLWGYLLRAIESGERRNGGEREGGGRERKRGTHKRARVRTHALSHTHTHTHIMMGDMRRERKREGWERARENVRGDRTMESVRERS